MALPVTAGTFHDLHTTWITGFLTPGHYIYVPRKGRTLIILGVKRVVIPWHAAVRDVAA